MSADEMPMTGNTIVVVAIGTEPVIGAAATDANVAAKLQNTEKEKNMLYYLHFLEKKQGVQKTSPVCV